MADGSTFSLEQYGSSNIKPSSGSKSKLLFIVILVLFLVLAGFGAYKFLGSKSGKSTGHKTPTPTQVQFPTDTPTLAPSGSPAPKTSPSPSVSPTASSVDKKTGLDRSTLSVEVQNGSGTVGAATKMSDFLKNLGYHVTSIGNADNFNYDSTVVEVTKANSKFLNLLKSDLSSDYTVGSSSAVLSSSSAGALVIVGKQ